MTFMRSQLRKLDQQYERIEAVTAEDPVVWQNNDYWNTWERPLKATERACVLSHLSVWKRLAAGTSSDPVLILEDDALLSNRLSAVLHAVDLITDIDYLNLEVALRRKLLAASDRYLIDGIRYLRLYQDRNGTGAYVLWPSGARKLVTEASRAAGLADGIICRTAKLLSYQVEPACAVQISLCSGYGITQPIEFSSSIAADKSVNTKFRSLKFRCRRIKGQLSLGLKALRHAHHAVRRDVRLCVNDFRRMN